MRVCVPVTSVTLKVNYLCLIGIVTVWDAREELVQTQYQHPDLELAHTPTLPPSARFFLVCLPLKPSWLCSRPLPPHRRENCTEQWWDSKNIVGRDFVLHKLFLAHQRLAGDTISSCVHALSSRSVLLWHSLETRAVSCGQCQVGLARSGVTNVLTESKFGLVFI